MDLKLKGKVGIITGASRGIGAGIARGLGQEGCRLVLTARDTKKLNAVADDVKARGGEAFVNSANLIESAAASSLVEATVKHYGRLDFVVANAGSARTGNFLKLTDDDWNEGFGLKFFGHMRLLKAAWPHLVAAKGCVVTLAGGAARTPTAHAMITGAVNAAVLNFTKALADRGLADGVRVNGVIPGSIRTERWKGRLEKVVREEGISAEEAEERLVKRGKQIRIGEPDDVASMVAFVISDRGSYMNGSLVEVDGGRNKGV